MESGNTGINLNIPKIVGILLKILSIILLVVGTLNVICYFNDDYYPIYGYFWDIELRVITNCAILYGIGEIIGLLYKIGNFGIRVIINLLQEIKNNTNK